MTIEKVSVDGMLLSITEAFRAGAGSTGCTPKLVFCIGMYKQDSTRSGWTWLPAR